MGILHKSRNKSISASQPEETQPSSSSGEPAQHVTPSLRSTDNSAVKNVAGGKSPQTVAATPNLSSASNRDRSRNSLWSHVSGNPPQATSASSQRVGGRLQPSTTFQSNQGNSRPGQSRIGGPSQGNQRVTDRETARRSLIFPLQRSAAASPPQSLRRIFSQRAEAYISPSLDSRPPLLPETEPGRHNNLSPFRLKASSTDSTTDRTKLPKSANQSRLSTHPSAMSLQGGAAPNPPLPKPRMGAAAQSSLGRRDMNMNNSTAELQGNGRIRVRDDLVPNQASPSNSSKRSSLVISDQPLPSEPQDQDAAEEKGVDEVALLQNRLKELDNDYAKLKGLYRGEKTRVYNLQNVIASQQMTKTHTILDDGQYIQLFQQLDGAITTLAFHVRKDWAVVPMWLKDYVHEDAVAVGTKEMTAVGRALLSRVVHDEIFEQHFHPGIYENLSKTLKKIELNLRCLHVNPAMTKEARERGAAHVAVWRTATMEGLSGLIQRDTEEGKAKLTMSLTEDWLSRLREFFKSPAPACLESGLRSIIEIALNLLEFKALETRDIQTMYFLPNQEIDMRLMTKDASLPTLPIGDGSDAKNPKASDEQLVTKAPKKRSTLTAFRMKMHGVKEQTSRPTTPVSTSQEPNRDAQLANRLRFAAFFAVEVIANGKSHTLQKAPVYPWVP